MAMALLLLLLLTLIAFPGLCLSGSSSAGQHSAPACLMPVNNVHPTVIIGSCLRAVSSLKRSLLQKYVLIKSGTPLDTHFRSCRIEIFLQARKGLSVAMKIKDLRDDVLKSLENCPFGAIHRLTYHDRHLFIRLSNWQQLMYTANANRIRSALNWEKINNLSPKSSIDSINKEVTSNSSPKNSSTDSLNKEVIDNLSPKNSSTDSLSKEATNNLSPQNSIDSTNKEETNSLSPKNYSTDSLKKKKKDSMEKNRAQSERKEENNKGGSTDVDSARRETATPVGSLPQYRAGVEPEVKDEASSQPANSQQSHQVHIFHHVIYHPPYNQQAIRVNG